MPLIGVSTDQPHLVAVNDVPRRVPSFPIGIAVKVSVQVRVLFHQDPVLAGNRTPHLVVADHRKLPLVCRIPATQQEHAVLEGQ